MRLLSVFSAVLLSLCLALPWSAAAQSTPGVFSSYEAFRAELDPRMERRATTSVIELVTSLTAEDRQNSLVSETQILNLLPNPLTETLMLREEEWGAGFRQELLAYWDGETGYLYVRLVVHERPDGSVVIVRMNFNTVIDPLLAFF